MDSGPGPDLESSVSWQIVYVADGSPLVKISLEKEEINTLKMLTFKNHLLKLFIGKLLESY